MGSYGFGLAVLNGTLRHWLGFFVPSERVFGLYVVSMGVMAWVVWRSRRRRGEESRGFFAYALDRDVYGHRSARQDYVYFFANGFIYYGLIAQLLGSQRPFAVLVYGALTGAFGPLANPLLGGLGSKILFTIASALLFDLATFLLHYAMHKLSVLWPFHKIHHSAEVLTPITLFRMHPVDLLLSTAAVLAFTGAGLGIFGYLSGQPVAEYEVFGVNVVVFAFYLTGYNLRHSQVWLNYPAWMSHVLVSPAQHQVHHSTDPKHKDRNLGLIFAFWDALAGTLYVPHERERIEYGVTRDERNPYPSVRALFVKPFVESAHAARALLIRGPAKEAAILLAAILGSLVCLRAVRALGAGPGVATPSVYMDELTWTEIHDAMRSGITTAIVPSGGTEQNGPHMVLGKHDLVVRYAAGEVARRLGGTLVAPVVSYVPEGDIGPPATGNLPWDGTMGVPDVVLEQVLYWCAVNLRRQGFKYIFFVGDHGLSQKAQEEVAQGLASWHAEGVTVASVGDYYAANGQVEWLKKRGFSDEEIGSHASIRDTSELLYLQPSGVRAFPVIVPGVPNGITGNPARASKEIGKAMIELKIEAAVAEMQRIREAGSAAPPVRNASPE